MISVYEFVWRVSEDFERVLVDLNEWPNVFQKKIFTNVVCVDVLVWILGIVVVVLTHAGIDVLPTMNVIQYWFDGILVLQ